MLQTVIGPAGVTTIHPDSFRAPIQRHLYESGVLRSK
jgi:hypothetical protein